VKRTTDVFTAADEIKSGPRELKYNNNNNKPITHDTIMSHTRPF
jgi:hypothetical protein